WNGLKTECPFWRIRRGRAPGSRLIIAVAIAATTHKAKPHNTCQGGTNSSLHHGTALHAGRQYFMEWGVFGVVYNGLVVRIQIIGIQVVLGHDLSLSGCGVIQSFERAVSPGYVSEMHRFYFSFFNII